MRVKKIVQESVRKLALGTMIDSHTPEQALKKHPCSIVDFPSQKPAF